MDSKPTISIVIPAYNEEANLEPTVREVLEALGTRFSAYEIIIVNDGSKDQTARVADALAQENRSIKVIHNQVNMGFGASYRRGMMAAVCDYVGFLPSDDCVPSNCIAAMFEQVGEADIISHYTSNLEVRLPSRRIISRLYTTIMNKLFGLRLTYFNGPTIQRREVIQNVKITTDGFAFLSEIMVRLIRSGHSYIQIGTPIRDRQHGSSSALRPKNVISVLKTVGVLFWDVNLINRKIYNHSPQALPYTGPQASAQASSKG